MKYPHPVEYTCPVCGKKIEYDECFRGVMYLNDNCVAVMSYDCHGIPFRTICSSCNDKIMDEKGYDGEYYTELDECIDEPW